MNMNVEEIRAHCLKLQGAEEGFPFGEETLVFKVYGKIFLLLSLDVNPPSFNVKCVPEKAEELRAEFSSVLPGYHMNKKHWNTIICDGSIPRKLMLEWIEESYRLVAGKKVGEKKEKRTIKKK